ncbi:MAG: hypothetical protein FWD16_07590 [Clostridia bacterium]|nr:hypothetical protein [Clostridia bacterium]
MTITFPHLGPYHVAIGWLCRRLFPCAQVMPAPPITKKTLALGAANSPDFVCVPFKYTLGSYIEALDAGATVLLQAGGGCRYGYYAAVQEQILRDMGYKFELIKLFDGTVSPRKLYKICKRLGSTVSFAGFLNSIFLTFMMIRHMDRLDHYLRENIGFETEKGSFNSWRTELYDMLANTKNIKQLQKTVKLYEKKLKRIPTNKPADCMKVGIVGELYTCMEPFSNYQLEQRLAGQGMAIKRFINVTFLLTQKARWRKAVLRGCGPYLRYEIGADGADSVCCARQLARHGCHGVIHVKPFGCTPEVNAMPMLAAISRDYKMPILDFSFDAQTAETGVETRLEAFGDMLRMRSR